MKTTEAMIKQGYWLFRYRSHLPIILILFSLSCIWYNRTIYSYESVWFDMGCFLIAICGEIIRIVAVGYSADRTSGRNTKKQVAAEINQTGIYSIVRHPLYIGNFFMWFGISLYTRIWWLVAIFFFIYLLYYERIIVAEEDYLTGKFGDEYITYASNTPCILPNFKSYVPNKYYFRVIKVLRKENASLYGLVVVFILMEIFQDLVQFQKIDLGLHWKIIGISGTILYLLLRLLKKKTRILHNDKQVQKTCKEEQ